MPTLHWIGKDKVLNHHLDVPFRTLRQEYAHGEPDNGALRVEELLKRLRV